MAHTPGPWTYSLETQSDGSAENFSVESNGISFLGACSCCNGTHIDENAEANAWLIVAAPELLAALREAEETFRVIGEEGPSLTALELADKYAALIAKATGAA